MSILELGLSVKFAVENFPIASFTVAVLWSTEGARIDPPAIVFTWLLTDVFSALVSLFDSWTDWLLVKSLFFEEDDDDEFEDFDDFSLNESFSFELAFPTPLLCFSLKSLPLLLLLTFTDLLALDDDWEEAEFEAFAALEELCGWAEDEFEELDDFEAELDFRCFDVEEDDDVMGIVAVFPDAWLLPGPWLGVAGTNAAAEDWLFGIGDDLMDVVDEEAEVDIGADVDADEVLLCVVTEGSDDGAVVEVAGGIELLLADVVAVVPTAAPAAPATDSDSFSGDDGPSLDPVSYVIGL